MALKLTKLNSLIKVETDKAEPLYFHKSQCALQLNHNNFTATFISSGIIVNNVPLTDCIMQGVTPTDEATFDIQAAILFPDEGGGSGTPVSLAPVGLTPNPNGLSITGSVLNGQPANQFNPGFLTALNQYVGGEKTFFDPITARIMQGFRLFNTINLNDRGDILYTSRGRGSRGESNIFGSHVFDTYAIGDSFLLSVAELGNIKFKVLRNGTVRISGLSTSSIAPVTITGTTQQVITDENGDLSFQAFGNYPEYVNNTTAKAGGLVAGNLYRTPYDLATDRSLVCQVADAIQP